MRQLIQHVNAAYMRLLILMILVPVLYSSSLKAQANFNDGPGGPVLVISTSANPFSRYYVEILRAQGLNAFAARDITQVTADVLNGYDVAILGEMVLSAAAVTMLTDWVNAGGTLIAMRPDVQLLSLLGLTAVTGTVVDKYLRVNTATEQGKGIVSETIQFHGTANRYTTSGATSLAMLYSSATVATTNPAVTVRDVGTSGGQAVAFAYDLARSIVYTRQGNPAWSGRERDGITPIRSNDLYYGNAASDPKPDWVDLNKVAIPQADEQQHLLTNIILKGNADKKPLPRFWFLPRGLKAAVVMTGDDHANGGTSGRFNQYKALSPSNTASAVNNWLAIRGSSYIFPNTPLSNTQAQAFQAEGFDLGVHLNTNCSNFTSTSLQNFFTAQLQQFANAFPSLTAPVTHRIHCLVWSDYATQAKVELNNKIRLDVNYYYWPGKWVQDRAGMFTGSGMPMRFAEPNGTIVNNYQVATQITDESDQTISDCIDELLDKATGPEGYYGVFCANMHTDAVVSTGSDAIISSAVDHSVPVISAKQLLTWLDARNTSTLGAFDWSNNTLTFSITAATGAFGLESMMPMDHKGARLTTITSNGSSVAYRKEIIKGIEYAIFPAVSGTYAASYDGLSCTPPTTTLDAIPADCQGQSVALRLITATGTAPYTAVVNGQSYSNIITGQRFASIPVDFTERSIWESGGTPQNANVADGSAVELGVKIRASVPGTITGIRFYKGSSNTGTHTGSLWSSTGTRLATGTFNSETATGWQVLRFSTPVSINANTTYIASYFSPQGVYAVTSGFFNASEVVNGPLTALRSSADASNGVYRYGSSSFPDQSYNATNYWVDVLFKPASYTFTLTSLTDANGCNNTGNISTVQVTQQDVQAGTQTFYRDSDGDTYGDAGVTQNACTAPTGYVAQAGDCNDNNAAIRPGATEICDGKDNNCNGSTDEGCTIYYRDADNDGFGTPGITTTGTTPPAGYVAVNTDCNDNNASVKPGATEVCANGLDDNCNGATDEGCTVSTEQSIWGSTANPADANS